MPTREKILDIWGIATDLVILSVLWTICSLPVVTMGAASAALYYCAVRGVRQHIGGGLSRLFFNSFRLNLKQATGYGLAALGVALVLAGTIWVFLIKDMGALGAIYIYMSAFFLALLGMYLIHLFPLIGRFSMDRKNLLAATITLVRLAFGRTLMLLLVLSLLAFLCVLYPPTLLIASGGFAYLLSFFEEPLFPRIIRFEDEKTDEERP